MLLLPQAAGKEPLPGTTGVSPCLMWLCKHVATWLKCNAAGHSTKGSSRLAEGYLNWFWYRTRYCREDQVPMLGGSVPLHTVLHVSSLQTKAG